MNIFYNNKHTLQVFLVFLIFLFGKNGMAQTSIGGKITDVETGEEMIAANIQVFKKGIFIQGETTDIDGNYNIKLDEGIYYMEISYTGYPTKELTDIVVYKGKLTKVDVQLKVGEGNIISCDIGCWWGYIVPLIQHDKTSTGLTLENEKIKKIPTRNINKIISITPGVSFIQ